MLNEPSRRRDERPDPRDPRRRHRGQADDRPDPGQHHRHPAAHGRRDRRLRGHRADAALLHPAGPPPPLLRQAPAGDLRAVGDHRRRAARRQGGRLPGRRPPGLHHRGADGRRDRRRAAGPRGDRQHGRRHRRRHDGGGGHQPRRHRHQPVDPDGRRRPRPGDHQLDEEGVLADARASAPPRRSRSTLGSAFPLPEEPEAEIRGRDMVSGLPRNVVVSSAEVRQALEEPLHAIIDSVRTTLDKTPPELAGDIMDRGIVLAGGGALLRGLDERLRHETGMPVHVADTPARLGGPRAPASASRSSRRCSRSSSPSSGR